MTAQLQESMPRAGEALLKLIQVIQGLVSFVTGGASGLGRETVKHLAKQGGCIISIDLPASKGQEVAESIGDNVLFVPCDVTSETDVSNALAICKEKYGRLDLAVNCAGLSRAFRIASPHLENVMDIDSFEIVYKSCVYGTFNVTRLGAQLMSQNEPKADGQRGIIINTGSLSSEDGVVGQCAFSAAKGAVVAMTLPIARELSSLGIRVVTLSPGLFETPLTDVNCLSEPAYNYYQKQTIFPKRFGKPSEFAQMVESIVLNPMLNGENIKITGGLRFHVKIFSPQDERLSS